jgi:hypothetical protein
MIFRYSAIECAYVCPKKYELEYVLGQRPEIKSLDMAFGTAIHAAINAHFEGGDAQGAFALAWGLLDGSYEKSRFNQAQLKDIGERLLSKWVRLHAAKYTPKNLEQKLDFKVGKHSFSGTLDFFGDYMEHKDVICDWKTTGYAYDKRMPLVMEQMFIYAEARYQNFGNYPTAIMYAPFVKGDASIQTPIILPFTIQKHREMLANVEAIADDLSSRKEFTKNRYKGDL